MTPDDKFKDTYGISVQEFCALTDGHRQHFIKVFEGRENRQMRAGDMLALLTAVLAFEKAVVSFMRACGYKPLAVERLVEAAIDLADTLVTPESMARGAADLAIRRAQKDPTP